MRAKEVTDFINSLAKINQLGRVKGSTNGVEVEILRPGFGKTVNKSFRIFPGVEVRKDDAGYYLQDIV